MIKYCYSKCLTEDVNILKQNGAQANIITSIHYILYILYIFNEVLNFSTNKNINIFRLIITKYLSEIRLKVKLIVSSLRNFEFERTRLQWNDLTKETG